MIYLAQPYFSPSPALMQMRYELGLKVVASLHNQGYIVYAPVVAWHPASVRYKLSGDAQTWWDQNKFFLKLANSLIILSAPGWQTSEGLKQEASYAETLNIDILWIDPRASKLNVIEDPVNLRVLLGETPFHGQDIPQRDAGRKDS